LAGDWRGSALVALSAAKPQLPQTTGDLGAAPPSARLERMLLLLEPSAAQQQALTAELANQQNPSSTEYHHWLTPAAFANSFANSAADVAAVSAWLQSQGFQVAALPAGRGWIEFSGTVAQVEQAFQTQIDFGVTAAGTRAVLTGSISVPAALKPLVHGLVSLDGALSAASLTTPRAMTSSASELAAQTSLSQAEALTPQLAARLLNLEALHSAGINGAGQTIAIAARSNVNSDDVAAFRKAFGLPASLLTVTPNGTDPGLTADQAESTLAASWAGAAAPGAQILLAPAATTGATDGLDLSLAAIVDQQLANTVAVGYSSCEAALGEAHQAFYAALYQQAAAEGMAVIAATGDGGPSACFAAGSTVPVSSGYNVNALASTPWNTAVGVAAYGSAGPAAGVSALAAWTPTSSADPAYAGGGGSSTLYAVPSWQPIPVKSAVATNSTNADIAANQRLLPDLALPTALDSGVNHGLAFCMGASTSSTGCTLVRSGGSAAAAALFAGIAALVAEKNGAQGNLAPNLYTLSQASGIFNDVQQGSAQLPCVAGSPGCGATEVIGYSAASGFDLATGLGTVNANALVTQWSVRPQVGNGVVSVALAITPWELNFTYNPSAQVTLTASVVSQTGGATPTGTATFKNVSTGLPIAGTAPVTLDINGNASLSLALNTAFSTTSSYNLVAVYNGDSTYEALTSVPPLTVTTEKSCTKLTVVPTTTTPTVGASLSVTVNWVVNSPVCGPPAGNATPTGSITLNVSGGTAISYTSGLTTTVIGTTTTTTATFSVPVTTTTDALQAVYSGDTYYAASTSDQVTLTVVTPPTVAVTLGTTTPQPGSTLAVSATVTPVSSTGTAPTGTVTFYLDGVSQMTQALVAGSPSTASGSITVPTTGTHIVTATYNGDSNYTSSTSTGVSFTVAKIVTSLILTPSSTTPAPGGSLILTATIPDNYSGTGLASGSVTFLLDGVSQGVQPLVLTSGLMSASLTITAPSTGTHTLLATYGGDTYFASATSNAVTITMAKTSTTMTVTPATTVPSVGSSLLVTATISPSAVLTTLPTGTVTFTFDGVTEVVGTVVSGSPATATATFIVPSAGSHSLQATYSGDGNYLASTASAVTLNVAKTAPTVVVTPATLVPTAGSTLGVSASITAPSTSATAATGNVTFMLDGVAIGTGTVVSGSPSTASITTAALTTGIHTLQAIYNGDTNYTSVASSTVNVTASKSATSLTVVPATTTPIAGNSMQVTANLTATIAGTTIPTGTVTFTMDGSTVGSTSLVSGTSAYQTITVPPTGLHVLAASYSGDSNYNSSISPSVTFTVAKTATTTVVTPSTTTPALGSTLPVSVSITPAAVGSTLPSGTVTFTLDGAAAGTVAVQVGSPSTANITLAALTPGTHTLTATYSGDTYYATSTGAAATITVPKSPTTLLVTPATTAPAGGTALVVTATLTATTPGSSLPTGTVIFTLDGTSVGTSAIVSGSPSTATVTLASTAVIPGVHVLAATYSGDSYYGASTAPPVTMNVTKGSTATTLTPSTLTPTAGGSMVVTASITSPNPVATLPSGTVTIMEDGVSVGIGTVTTGSPSTATVTISLVNAGTHLLQAIYSGDTYYTGSTSPSVSIIAAKAATVTTVTATPAALAAGVTETLTATIAPVNAVTGTIYTITGTVSFYDAGTLLGKVAVSSNTAALTGVTLANNTNHTITAIYSGDINWLASASSVLPLAASTLPDYVVLTSNLTTVSPGAALILTATVTPTATPITGAEQNPTGNVLFYNGTTLIGTAALAAVSPGNTSVATLTVQNQAGGIDTFSAIYAGDLYYDMATSNLLNITVQDFTITASPSNPATNLNIIQGASGSAAFIVTGLGGFDNQIQVVCAVPSQDDMTCTATPQQVTPTAAVTFVVQTYITGGPSSVTTVSQRKGPLWPRAAGGTALAVLGFFLLPFGRRTRIFAGRGARRFWVLLLLLIGLGAAGMGCNNSTLVASSGTPLGVSTIKITATAYVDNTVVSRSIYLSVNVLANTSSIN
jgi:subtilase family serine protease